MSDIPANLKYTESHEWVELGDDGLVRIGITDHAQELLGDMVYIEVPEVGTNLDAGDECAVVESVKAASDVYAPLSGEVVAINENLGDNPELVNTDPYDKGWLYTLKPREAEDIDELMDATAYEDKAAEDDH